MFIEKLKCDNCKNKQNVKYIQYIQTQKLNGITNLKVGKKIKKYYVKHAQNKSNLISNMILGCRKELQSGKKFLNLC